MSPRPLVALWRTTVVELRLYLREPAAAFFTLLLPLLLLALNGAQGNAPRAALGGAGLVDVLLPGYVALVIATSGLMVLPVTLTQYRERGILRRLHATPVSPLVALGAQLAVCLAMTTVGLVLLIACGLAFFGLNPPERPGGVVAATLLGALSFFGLSLILAAVAPSSRTAQAVASALYFPMIFVSGATWPREALPDVVARVGEWLPLSFVVDAIQAPWQGGTATASLGVLAVSSVAGLILSARLFRWS